MPWEVEYTDEFEDWWLQISETQQEAVAARVELLQQNGPNLGRPTVDLIKTSRHKSMKELRCSSGGDIRVFFIFDPTTAAILLIGGIKSPDDPTSPNWNDWYDLYVPIADDLYDEHLAQLKKEGTD